MVLSSLVFLGLIYYNSSFSNNLRRNTNSNVNPKVAVVVRFSNATESQIKRYFDWELSLPENYEFWFIINPIDETVEYRKKNTYYITMKRIYDTYPSIRELRLPKHCINANIPDDKFYMWISHTESIMQWYHYTNNKYDYVWILEQDLGVTGSLSTILDHYNESTSDFISFDVAEETPKFPHFHCYSNNYLEWRLKYSDKNKGYSTREFIQRWSKNLFNKLDEELINGMHAISEMSVVETTVFNNLTYELLDSNQIGYKFGWNKRVGKGEWEKIRKKPKYNNQLFHALKF